MNKLIYLLGVCCLCIICCICCYFIYKKVETFDNNNISPTLVTSPTPVNPEHIVEQINHKVVFCGITRDNAPELPVVMESMENTGNRFLDYRVIIFENDSKDGTKEILKKWAEKNPKVKIISQDFHNTKRPSIQFMADCRNKYIDEMEQHKDIYEQFDYMIVVDMDMHYGWNVDILIDSFKHKKNHDWDVVCSNGLSSKNVMYDAFAYRSDEFPQNLTDGSYWGEVVPKIQNKKRDKWEEVHSCFGGLAIYRRDVIASCRYSSEYDDCEHVKFHECIRKNGGKVFLNPNQKIKYTHYQE